MNKKEKTILDEIISSIPNPINSKISLLQKVQARFEYLKEEHMKYIAKSIGTSYTDIYGIATFYSYFNLYPAGRHTILICEGTSCHVKGGQRIRKKLKDMLGIDIKETTPDKRFSLKSIRCLGCCGISPVIMVDKETFGRVKPTALEDILSKFK
ncbi:MAG: NADH-quinone oxidoreductase subunit NuoE [Thermoplasmata archaeon]